MFQAESVQSIQHVFSNNLKRIRNARKLSQEALAELSGLSPRYIQMLEAGTSWPRLKAVRSIAKSLKIKETDLFSPR